MRRVLAQRPTRGSATDGEVWRASRFQDEPKLCDVHNVVVLMRAYSGSAQASG
jgi:hypothetical protein